MIIRLTKSAVLFLLTLVLIIQTNTGFAQHDTTTISIKVITGLQFDLPRFRVKPGATVKLVFTNTDDMAHNLVITKPGAREAVVNIALQLGEKGPAMGYVPKSSQILWAIPIVLPEEKKSVVFTAPASGVYPYVCTFPGHGFVMYGAMYVTNDTTLPNIKKDLNIPEVRRKASAGKPGGHEGHDMDAMQPAHPYKLVPPFLYRVFMEGAGPAAIAVRLPNHLSYCWDAGACRLRYAWEGEFVDNTKLWAGHKDATATILGTVFYRDKTAYPLRIKAVNDIPAVDFKGYRLINRYPEFHYTINGTDVYELIKPTADSSGLIRTFRMPGINEPAWFVYTAGDEMTYTSSAGQWEGDKLRLSAEEAKTFTITMVKKK